MVPASGDRVRVRARDWSTALAVGLNDVDVRLDEPGRARYRIEYWRWAAYVLALGGFLGVVGIALLLAFDVRAYIAAHPATTTGSPQGVLIAWAMVVFWGFVWPWLLIALHKPALHRLMGRIIGEMDAAAASPNQVTHGGDRR